jgi:hypothetical protein
MIPHANSIFERMAQAIRRESRKAVVLTFLLATLGILWIRMAMKGKDGPQRAIASMQTPKNDQTGVIGTTPSMSPESGESLRKWLAQPLAPLGRNLFVVNLDHYPQEPKTLPEQTSAGGGFWGEIAKSVSAAADVTKERQILVENLTQQASQLRLQSTLMGPKPKAVINGEMVGEGDVVACGSGETRGEFRVLKIEARRIVIEREGIKLEVTMK